MTDPNYDEITMWKVDALKDFLRRRNLKSSGRKQELVARVFAAIEQNIPVSLEAVAIAKQAEEERRNLLLTAEGILPDPSDLKEGWLNEYNGMTKWPPISLSNITTYVMKDHPGNDISLQSRLLNEYKEGKAYRLYDGDWLKEVHFHPIKDDSKYCFLKAQCTPSMKINDLPHSLWICTQKTGEIQSCFCTCTAGLGGSCAHITAMFFRIEAAVKAGYTTCTSKLCQWKVPNPKTKIQPMQVKDMVFKATKFNKDTSRIATAQASRKLFKPIKDQPIKDAKITRETIFNDLKDFIPNGCFTSFFEKEAKGVQEASLNVIITQANQSKTTDEFINSIPVLSEDDVHKIEQSTIGQSNNDEWITQRKGRITASNFYVVYTKINSIKKDTSKEHNTQSLVKMLMGYNTESIQQLPSIQHGHRFEPIAKEKYILISKGNHIDLRYRECGLFVDKYRPYLGATPDLLIECKCCGLGVAEFKCPYSIVEENPTAENLSYLHVDPLTKATKLKKNHPYFAQIQGQMAICDRKYCDFFVFTNAGYFLHRISFENDYWSKLVANIEYFFNNYLAEELVCKKLAV